MRILIISYYFPPMNAVASHRIYSWARTWVDAGHTVTVLTAPKPSGDDNFTPNVQNIRIVEASNLSLKFLQNVAAKKYQSPRIPSGTSKINKPFSDVFKSMNEWRKKRGLCYTHRMPDYLSLWSRSALKKTKGESYDLVVSSFGPYVTHLLAERIIARNSQVKWIADFRDLWIDHGSMTGLYPFTIIEKKHYKRILNKADLITTVSRPLAEKIGKYCKKNKIVIIYNGFLKGLYSLPVGTMWTDKKVRLVYTGTIYDGPQNYIPLLKALKNLTERDYKLSLELEIVIASRRHGQMIRIANELGVGAFFKIKGNVSHSRCLQMQRDAHGLLFFDYDPQVMEGVITGKLFEYLVSGTPIWSIGQNDRTTDSHKLIETSKAGTIFGTDIEKIYQRLRILIHEKRKPRILIDMEPLNQYDRKVQALKMLDAISNDC